MIPLIKNNWVPFSEHRVRGGCKYLIGRGYTSKDAATSSPRADRFTLPLAIRLPFNTRLSVSQSVSVACAIRRTFHYTIEREGVKA